MADGDEATMFGGVSAVATDGERIYVADRQVPAVRIYDSQGRHLGDLGRVGEGPGEFRDPASIGILPDGRVAIFDWRLRRLTVFGADGTLARTWEYDGEGFFVGLEVMTDGTPLVRLQEAPTEAEVASGTWETRYAVAPLLDDGTLGAVRRPPDLGYEGVDVTLQVNAGGGARMASMRPGTLFFPAEHWTVRSDGALVAGVSDAYRFEIHARDGTVTAVERYWDPVPVPEERVQYQIALVEGVFRQLEPAWQYDRQPPPGTHPAYDDLTTGADGRTLLMRSVGSRRLSECVEDPREDFRGAGSQPCWHSDTIVDVFAPDGEYLGELHRPQDLTFGVVYADGDTYLAAVEDEDGLVMVKRYRIVIDGGEGE